MRSCQNLCPGSNTRPFVTASAQAVVFLAQGYAVKAGMLCARGELLLMADADGATVAAEEQRLEEALQKVKACHPHWHPHLARLMSG